MNIPDRKIGLLLALLLMQPCLNLASENPALFNGFIVDGGLIDPVDIYYGGPDRDGIPAIDNPSFLAGSARDGQLAGSARIMGVNFNGIAKAFPVSILDQHEIVNDRFNGKAVAITFCPLCGTGMVFRAEARGEILQFGVSGLLYNSDVLLYDRGTQSLWSQIMKTAVTGPMKGEQLSQIPAQYTTWEGWLESHPDSLLLSRDTGFRRNYRSDVYYDYKRLPMIMFPTVHQDYRIPGKHWVVGITVGDESLAVPFEQLDRLDGVLRLVVGGIDVDIHWDRKSSSARAFNAAGDEIPTTSGYWFAWVAFHPRTSLYYPDLQ